MTDNYYDILGVTPEATQDEIKKAFRKLSIQYHPDRQSSKSEKEQKEAEEKFKKINEAYSVLNDPEKRQQYDRPNHGGGTFEFDLSDIFGSGIFDMFGHTRSYNQGNGFVVIERGEDIALTIKLSISEIFSGCSKTIDYRKNIRCSSCGGVGGKTKICPNCNGNGRQIRTRRTIFGLISEESPCPECKGTGRILLDTCPDCKGTGFKQIDASVVLNLKPHQSIKPGITYTFESKGSESSSNRGPSGSLIVRVLHDYDKQRYLITDNNIVETVLVPYRKILEGSDWTVTLPDSSEAVIKIDKCLPCNSLIEIPVSNGKYWAKIVPSWE